jgi:hypothetical protein
MVLKLVFTKNACVVFTIVFKKFKFIKKTHACIYSSTYNGIYKNICIYNKKYFIKWYFLPENVFSGYII